ncbi:MAG: 2,3-diaminopropionate biosynthesis protein SbnB [Saprospiraceae bacterium]|nr:MAG: 2,3-diaminopropionate biosynthesis protein SbnB [Saprospiraceae bacterium]
MYYLNTKSLASLDRDWNELARVIEKAIFCQGEKEFAQPVKPYLRYRDMSNRIIAMPAFIGGEFNLSGIKWIASFPKNLDKGIKRAHSVSILNDADTGIPVCAINTTLISGIRTASVTGLMIKKYLELRPELTDLVVGMTGFGPIGQLHLEMTAALLGDRLKEFRIFDINPIDPSLIPPALADKVVLANSFEQAFEQVDLFITATVSSKPYIDQKPKPGSLHLNVSLRDYHVQFMDYVDIMIVDDWEEVCREKTDIEMMHLEKGLQKEDVLDLVDVFYKRAFEKLDAQQVVMFNPMGMAIFDIAIGAHFYEKARLENAGILLEN